MNVEIIAKIFFGGKVRLKVYQKLSALTRNGISLKHALNDISSRYKTRKSPVAYVIDEVLTRYRGGLTLGAALHGLAPAEECLLLEAASSSGALYRGMDLSCKLIQAKQKIVATLVKAVTYPLFLLCMLGVLISIVATKVVPEVSRLIPPEKWEGALSVLFHVSMFLASPQGVITIAGLLLGFVSILVSLPYLGTPLRIKLDYIPPWSMYRLVQGSTWLFTFSTMLSAGIQTSVILQKMINNPSQSPWLTERVEAIKGHLNLGKSVGQSMCDTGYNFPDKELVDDLRIYSSLAGFETALAKIANEWLEEGITKIEMQSTIVNTLFLVAIIGLLAGVLLSVASLQAQISTNLG